MIKDLFLLSLSLALATCSEAGVALNSPFLSQHVATATKSGPSRLATVRPSGPNIVSMQQPEKSKFKGLKADYVCLTGHLCGYRYELDGTVDKTSPEFEKVVQAGDRLGETSTANLDANAKLFYFKRWIHHADTPDIVGDAVEWALLRTNLDFLDPILDDAKPHGLNPPDELHVDPKAEKVVPLPIKTDTSDVKFEKLRLEWNAWREFFFVWCENWHRKLQAQEVDPSIIQSPSQEAYVGFSEMMRIEILVANQMENDGAMKQEDVIYNMKKLLREWERRGERRYPLHSLALDDSVGNHPDAHPFGLDPDTQILLNWARNHWTAEQLARDQEKEGKEDADDQN